MLQMLWCKAPFIRLTIPLAAGILLQWYLEPAATLLYILGLTGLLVLIVLFFSKAYFAYRYSFLNGIAINLIVISIGGFLASRADIRNNSEWYGHHLHPGSILKLKILEPLVEKEKSYKMLAEVQAVYRNDSLFRTDGKLLLYFKKDSLPLPGYGSIVLAHRLPQEIKNSGNPGAFNYQRYCLFQGITHQLFLQRKDWKPVPGNQGNIFWHSLYRIRENVLRIIRENVPGKKESGLAQALLIGYRDELDRDLVQTYSRTGVVHVIAISGLHLGLIYWILVQALKFLKKTSFGRWLFALLVIASLWAFSFLAGAQPSVLRSALMFSCLVVGEAVARKSFSINTLLFSAFILLCMQPFWLWDLGFQLSYAAVCSIIIFLRPISQLWFPVNPALKFLWGLISVTLAAQILTTPLCIFYFGQFPNYFLLGNIAAVPLSSVILIGEIILCCCSFWPAVSSLIGRLISWLIEIMNASVGWVEDLPYSIWEGIFISALQCVLAYAFVTAVARWLMFKNKNGLIAGLFFLLCFLGFRTFSFFSNGTQQKITIYNISGLDVMEIVDNRKAVITGDSAVFSNRVYAFHLQPSHRKNRIIETKLLSFSEPAVCMNVVDKRIMLLQGKTDFIQTDTPLTLDLLIVSGKAGRPARGIENCLKVKQIILQGTVNNYLAKAWKNRFSNASVHSVREDGAFVMRLN